MDGGGGDCGGFGDGGSCHVGDASGHHAYDGSGAAYLAGADGGSSSSKRSTTSYQRFVRENKGAGIAITLASIGLGAKMTYDSLGKLQMDMNKAQDTGKIDLQTTTSTKAWTSFATGITLIGLGAYTGHKMAL